MEEQLAELAELVVRQDERSRRNESRGHGPDDVSHLAVLAHLEDIGLDIGYYLMKRYRMIEDDPLSASTELMQRTVMRRGDWAIRLICRSRLTATEKYFQFSCDLETFEGDRPFVERSWAVSIPRKLV